MENMSKMILEECLKFQTVGTLDLYYGVMETGKTTALLMREYDCRVKAGFNTLVIKPSIDTKGEDHIISRLGVSRKTDFTFSAKENIYDKVINYMKSKNIDIIFVDEAQFITEKQAYELRDLAYYHDLKIYCYSLRVDFLGKSFSGSKALFEIANKRYELGGSCAICGKDAVDNLRYQLNSYEELEIIKKKSLGWKEIIIENIVFEGEQIFIDNQELAGYIPTCFYCSNTIKDGKVNNFKRKRIKKN